jgi:hypothetical protein
MSSVGMQKTRKVRCLGFACCRQKVVGGRGTRSSRELADQSIANQREYGYQQAKVDEKPSFSRVNDFVQNAFHRLLGSLEGL